MYSEYENSIEIATYESCWDIRGSSLQEGLRLGGGCVGEGAVLGKGLCWMWGVVVERGLCWRGCFLFDAAGDSKSNCLFRSILHCVGPMLSMWLAMQRHHMMVGPESFQ